MVIEKIALEIAIAKSLEYTVSTVLRQPGSPAASYYANLARSGLELGWNHSAEQLAWWTGAVAPGATGATDFFAAQAIGWMARDELDRVLDEHPKWRERVGQPTFEQALAAMKNHVIPGMEGRQAHALRMLAKKILEDT